MGTKGAMNNEKKPPGSLLKETGAFPEKGPKKARIYSKTHKQLGQKVLGERIKRLMER